MLSWTLSWWLGEKGHLIIACQAAEEATVQPTLGLWKNNNSFPHHEVSTTAAILCLLTAIIEFMQEQPSYMAVASQ